MLHSYMSKEALCVLEVLEILEKKRETPPPPNHPKKEKNKQTWKAFTPVIIFSFEFSNALCFGYWAITHLLLLINANMTFISYSQSVWLLYFSTNFFSDTPSCC